MCQKTSSDHRHCAGLKDTTHACQVLTSWRRLTPAVTLSQCQQYGTARWCCFASSPALYYVEAIVNKIPHVTNQYMHDKIQWYPVFSLTACQPEDMRRPTSQTIPAACHGKLSANLPASHKQNLNAHTTIDVGGWSPETYSTGKQGPLNSCSLNTGRLPMPMLPICTRSLHSSGV